MDDEGPEMNGESKGIERTSRILRAALISLVRQGRTEKKKSWKIKCKIP